MTAHPRTPATLASIQPVVLVGGASQRFGRDKLREPWGTTGQLLVQRPIDALRAVFGRRVMLVGECHPAIVPLADGVIPDQHPGVGPIGGVLSALMESSGSVFVLAGDMPNIEPDSIRSIVRVARDSPGAWATLASTDRLHPCVGVYTQAGKAVLLRSIQERRFKLAIAIPGTRITLVACSPDAVTNINTVRDIDPSPPTHGRPVGPDCVDEPSHD